MAHLDEIIRHKEAAEADLLKLKGTTGVDVGFKYVKGKRTDEIVVRVLVKEKKKQVPENQKVPKEINGIKTDVIEMEVFPLVLLKALDELAPLADSTKYSTAKGGISIGPERTIPASNGNQYITVGTLGCIVKDNATKNPLLLSNAHVMAVTNDWHSGDYMCQPGRMDGGVAGTDRIGSLDRVVLSQHVDGAVCSLSGRTHDCSIIDIGDVKGSASAALNAAVSKRGRTTLLTKGFVDSINATISLDYSYVDTGVSWVNGFGVHTLKNLIGIRPDTSVNPKFSDHGDSGSVVIDANKKVIGLLFAGNTSGYAYINPISYVISELNISLCTKPTFKLKMEKSEKGEVKELKLEKIEKLEKKEFKELKLEKLEKREIKEIDIPGKGYEIPGKGFENPTPINPGTTSIENRLNNLEQSISNLTAFIGENLRPDLSQGALTSEQDIAAAQEKLNKDILDNMG